MTEANVYKLSTSDGKPITFQRWKVRNDTSLSDSDVVFEYKKEDSIKVDKYKCNMNGIIVKELFEIKPGDILSNGASLFSYEPCSHSIVVNKMCATCGEDLKLREEAMKKMCYAPPPPLRSQMPVTPSLQAAPQQSSGKANIPMVPHMPYLQLTQEEAQKIAKKDLTNLVKNKKLVLLVDLDHTLIHTTNEQTNPNIKDVFRYELCYKNIWYHTKFRPGCKHFIENMSKLYELHIVTFGDRMYAETIANFMDPKREYFHNRILSRNEIFNPTSKTDNLKALFPCGDLMVTIIDDREDVWNYAPNLICVQPYVFFKNVGDINDPTAAATAAAADTPPSTATASSSSSSSSSPDEGEKTPPPDKPPASTPTAVNSEDDPDDYLTYLEKVLTHIHDSYYSIHAKRLAKKYPPAQPLPLEALANEADLPDMKRVLPLIKRQVLKGVCITFSGVVPTLFDLKKQRCYLMATSLGATVNEKLVLPRKDDEDDDEAHSDHSASSYEYDELSLSTASSNSSGKKKRREPHVTTHLVAAKYGTIKVHEAARIADKVHVVTPEWLLMCHFRWTHCAESEFRLTEAYDYKRCVFHHEYNQHQRMQHQQHPGVANKPQQKSSSSGSEATTSKLVFNEEGKKTKKKEVGEEEDDDDEGEVEDDGDYEEEEEPNGNLLVVLNDNDLNDMDKEVEDELGSDDDDDEEEEEVNDDDENGDEESHQSKRARTDGAAEKGKDDNDNEDDEIEDEDAPGTDSSSSSNSSNNSDDFFDKNKAKRRKRDEKTAKFVATLSSSSSSSHSDSERDSDNDDDERNGDDDDSGDEDSSTEDELALALERDYS